MTLRINRNIWDWLSCFGFVTTIQDKAKWRWGGIIDNEIMKIGRIYHSDHFNSFHHNVSSDYSQMPIGIHLWRLLSTDLNHKQLNMFHMVYCLKFEYTNKSSIRFCKSLTLIIMIHTYWMPFWSFCIKLLILIFKSFPVIIFTNVVTIPIISSFSVTHMDII